MSDRRYGGYGGDRRDYGSRDRDRGSYQDRGQGGGGRRDHDRRSYDSDRRGSGGYGGGGGGGYGDRRGSGGYGGGGGGRGGRGGRGLDPHRHQSSFVGRKRGRDEEAAADPAKQFIRRLLKLGEPGALSEGDMTNAGDTPERTLENALSALKQEIRSNNAQLHEVLLEAAVSCSHKTTHYALLLGMLHAEEDDHEQQEWMQALIDAAGARMAAELAAGGVDAPRLLLRFFASLSVTGVLHPVSVLALMARLLELAQAQASAGQDPSGLTWQPWTDQLVYGVLMGLIWGGASLAEGAPEQHAALMQALGGYMAARPTQESVELRPLYGAATADDAAAASDSGGASFLGQLWEAVQALAAAEQPWEVQGIPFALVRRLQHKLTGSPLELPQVALPAGVPGAPAAVADLDAVARSEIALALQERYPPRGGIRILDQQYTDGGRPLVERLVAEEYMLDLLACLDGHRPDLVQMLSRSLPLPYDYSGLLCETLFAQLLRLPHPRLVPLAFSAIIAHTALLRPAFPKFLAGSVRQLYLRVQFMAPELVQALAEVLAHFITNMSFRWPWDKYRSGLEQPPGGPQRTFLVLVLQHMVRLTSWTNELLLQETPPEFLALLGQPPAFQGVPTPVPYRPGAAQPLAIAAAAAGGAEPMAQDGDGAEGQQNGGAQQQQQQEGGGGGEGDAMAVDGDGGSGQQQADPVMVWAGRFMGVLQARPEDTGKPLSSEEVLEWMQQQQMLEALGGSPEAQLRAVVAAVLGAGSKSCSHVCAQLERHASLLKRVLEPEQLQQQGSTVLLGVLGHMYGQLPTRLHLALTCLVEQDVVSAADAAGWLASPARLPMGPAADEVGAADGWALLQTAINDSWARHQGAIEAKERLIVAVSRAEALASAAAAESAAAALAVAAAEGADDGEGPSRAPIPVPVMGGGGVSRVEFAKLREDAAVRRVEAAQQAVVDQDATIKRLARERGEALMQAFVVLSERMPEAVAAAAAEAAARAEQQQQQQDGGEGDDEDAEQQPRDPEAVAAAAAAASEAARQLVFAQVRSFCRMFRAQAVQLGLLSGMLQHVDGLDLEPDARAALLGPFDLA